MADPLSISASVAGLVGLAISLTQVSYQYATSVKGSSKAWSSYMQELSALTSVLLRLQAARDVPERDSILTVREPEVSKTETDRCIHELQQLKTKLDDKLAKKGIVGKLGALVWPFSEAETQKKVEMLHRYNSIFSSALLADNFTVSIASYRELRKQRQDSELGQILEWFRPRRSARQIGDVSEQQCPGTWSTFLGHEEYNSWRNQSRDCLWLSGDPGAGKTVLSAAVVGDLTKSLPNGCIVAYHFFHSGRLEHPGRPETGPASRQTDKNEESLQDLLCHLIFQSLGQSEKVVLEAAELYKNHKSSNLDLLPKDLVSALVAISKSCTAMYIVLDALDECQYLTKLARYLSTLTSSGIKILFTSRDIPDVRKHLGGYSQIEVKPDRNDILRYVDWRLREGEEVEYELLDDTLKNDIASALFEHAGRSFLLVRLLMDHITSLTTIKRIRKCLAVLPSDYNKAYQSTFDRILQQSDVRREVALKTLTWVSGVKVSLTMRQIQHALAAEDGEETVSDEDLESPKTILSSCLGLLRLSKTEQKVEFIHSSASSFIHSKVGLDADKIIAQACLRYMTTPEMASGPCSSLELFSSRLESLPFLEYAARFYGYHVRSVEPSIMAELKKFLEDERLRESSWQILHFVYDPGHVLGQDIFAGLSRHVSILHVASYWGFSVLLASLLADDGPLRAKALADIDIGESHGWTPLHWAASMGQVETAKLVLDAGAVVDAIDSSSWTPLFWAATKGHAEVTTLLLSRGANVYQVDSDGMAPAHWAVSAGQNATAEVLFRFMEKADVMKPRRRYELRYQENREHISIADAKRITASYSTSKSLIELSAEALDAEEFAAYMRSVEKMASQTGFYYGSAMEDAPSTDPFFRTLWKVKSKSDWGFWLRRRDKDPLSTFRNKLLERAIETEQVLLLKALLLLDADSRPRFAQGVTYKGDGLLHKACTRRNPEMVRVLITQGADPNQADPHGSTPLHHACRSGSVAIVDVLLGIDGLDSLVKDKSGQTPLMTLLSEGTWRTECHPGENLAICKALTGHDKSIYEATKDGNTMADMAVRLWDQAVISMLLDLGVGFSNTGKTALHIAASAPFDVSTREGFWNRDTSDGPDKYRISSSTIKETFDLVLGLIKYAEWDPVDSRPSGDGETPLALAIHSKNWVVACRLHELGAAFKTNRPTYPMIFQATRAGVPELVKLLIGAGVDINPSPTQVERRTPWHDEQDSNLLCEAVSLADDNARAREWRAPNHLAIGDYLAVMRVLIGAGVEVDGVDREGKNALEHAVTGAVPTPMLQTLLDAGSNPYMPSTNGLDYVQLALLKGSSSHLSYLWEYSRTHAAPGSHWLHGFQPGHLGEQTVDGTVHDFVVALKQACAIDVRDRHGHTLLFNAAMDGNQPLVETLIAHGAHVNDADPLGWTPLHAAVSRGDLDMTEFLLKCGADIKGEVKDETPWHADYSPRRGCSNAEINPLHLSLLSNLKKAHPKPLQLVRLLLDNGADPNREAVLESGLGYMGKRMVSTPIQQALGFPKPGTSYTLNEARFNEAVEIVELLVQRGAAVGDAALDLSLEEVVQFEGHEELWEALRQGMKSADDAAGSE